MSGSRPTVWIALLRGVNVGGKHRLPMARLAAHCVSAGAVDVTTHIQSGNVVFRADHEVARAIPEEMGKRVEREFGFRPPVLLRSATQLADIAASNPFAADANPDAWHVLFLKDEPGPQSVAALDPDRSRPDRFVVRGSEIFLSVPGSAADTKLTCAYFDRRLETTATGRNWRTVLALADLARQ